MYKINFNKYFELLNWNVIYWGIKNNFILSENAIDYANKLAENESEKASTLIVELLILEDINKEKILSLISKAICQDEIEANYAKRVFRYMILEELKESGQDNKKTLKAIEDVYADFDYPQDMEAFIGYMPVADNSYDPKEHSKKENEQRLIKSFNLFLEEEYEKLKNGI